MDDERGACPDRFGEHIRQLCTPAGSLHLDQLNRYPDPHNPEEDPIREPWEQPLPRVLGRQTTAKRRLRVVARYATACCALSAPGNKFTPGGGVTKLNQIVPLAKTPVRAQRHPSMRRLRLFEEAFASSTFLSRYSPMLETKHFMSRFREVSEDIEVSRRFCSRRR